MPLDRYGVLVGRAVDRRREGRSDSPHYQVLMSAGGASFRVAVNVQVAAPAVGPAVPGGRRPSAPGHRGPAGATARLARPAARAGRPVRWTSSGATCSTRPDAHPAAGRARSRQRPGRPARPLRRARDRRPGRGALRLRSALGAGAGQGQDLRLRARQRRPRHPHEPGQRRPVPRRRRGLAGRRPAAAPPGANPAGSRSSWPSRARRGTPTTSPGTPSSGGPQAGIDPPVRIIARAGQPVRPGARRWRGCCC